MFLVFPPSSSFQLNNHPMSLDFILFLLKKKIKKKYSGVLNLNYFGCGVILLYFKLATLSTVTVEVRKHAYGRLGVC